MTSIKHLKCTSSQTEQGQGPFLVRLWQPPKVYQMLCLIPLFFFLGSEGEQKLSLLHSSIK